MAAGPYWAPPSYRGGVGDGLDFFFFLLPQRQLHLFVPESLETSESRLLLAAPPYARPESTLEASSSDADSHPASSSGPDTEERLDL